MTSADGKVSWRESIDFTPALVDKRELFAVGAAARAPSSVLFRAFNLKGGSGFLRILDGLRIVRTMREWISGILGPRFSDRIPVHKRKANSHLLCTCTEAAESMLGERKELVQAEITASL